MAMREAWLKIRVITFIVAFIVGVTSFWMWDGYEIVESTKQGRVQIANTEFMVEIADDDAKRAQGLSGRTELAADQGMWFTIPESRSESSFFWMKDMLIPIDMIWINDGKVVWIHENVPTQPGASDDQLISYAAGLPPIYPDRVDSEQELQPLAIDAVLEVAAGVAADSGIQVGDTVTFEKL